MQLLNIDNTNRGETGNLFHPQLESLFNLVLTQSHQLSMVKEGVGQRALYVSYILIIWEIIRST